MPKQSGGVNEVDDIRLCINLQKVNLKLKEPIYTLPTPVKMFRTVGGVKFFTEINLFSAYHHIKVEEDSQSLLGFVDPQGIQYFWMRLSFDSKGVVFIKGIENVLPDFLSHCYVKEEVSVEYKLPLVGLDVRNVNCDSEPEVYTKERLEEFLNSVINKCESIDKDKLFLVQNKHNESYMGVFGTFNNLFHLGYYWSNMQKMVEKVCTSCMECLCYNVGKIGFHLLTPVSVTLLMDLIAIDFVCGLFETSDGFTVGLIIINCTTHFVFLCLLKSKSSKAVAEALLEVFYNFGFPWEIQSDQDPSFMSKSMDKFRKLTEAHSRKVLKYFPA